MRSSRLCRLPSGRTPWERFQADHLVRNSPNLVLNSGLQAALGFAFWLIAARLFATADAGRASSLIAATALISYVALLDLNSTSVRYLPTAPDRDAMLTAGLHRAHGRSNHRYRRRRSAHYLFVPSRFSVEYEETRSYDNGGAEIYR